MATPPRPGAVDLAGRVRLVPGAPAGQAAIVSTRRELAPLLAVGRPAALVPDLLASLFTLCAEAHRWTARRAVAVAAGRDDPLEDGFLSALRWSTLREHLVRIAHDWPQRLPGATEAVAGFAMALCPLWRKPAGEAPDALAVGDWLARHWLGCAPETWLARIEADADAALDRWLNEAASAPARLLGAQFPALAALRTAGGSMALGPDAAATARALAAPMADVPGFNLQPRWPADPAETVPDTGPWARQRDGARRPARHAADRMAARLVEAVRLSAPDGERVLSHGVCALGPGESVAWTEMARGLLLHRVRLDGDRVADWRVLAPTEWNFHPEGVLAAALRLLDPTDIDGALRLALAFDPCVEVEIANAAPDGDDVEQPQESPHA